MTRRDITDEQARRRGVVRTATLLALLAVGFYIAFILVTAAGN
ncbi:MAG: hypothetical protein ACOCP9_05590 [Halofilum sp. (in: g-proteobacteria)]